MKATHLNIEIIFNYITNTLSLTTMFTLSCLLKPSGRVHFALVSHDMHAWINTWSYPWLTAPATICWHGTLNFALNFHRTHIFYLLSFLDSHQLIFKIPETFFNSLFFPNMFFFNFYFIFKLYNIVLVFAKYRNESAKGIHVFPILNPPPSSLPIPSLWVVPVHQHQASSIMPRTWTSDSFHIWYYTYFNAILPHYPTLSLSHRVQKTVLYISVSFAVSYTGLLLPSF